jgi:hypothetical protein
MSYKRPEYTTMHRLPKQGRTEYYRVDGFLSKEEAQEYADWYYQSNWGYGPSTRVSLNEDGTFTVNINQMDCCD